jgi:hypothetical protein
MKKYKVLQDFSGSQQGFTAPEDFKAGEIVELHDHLAEVALQYGYAELSGEDAPEVAEEKAITKAPANKAIKRAPSNK